MELGRWIGKIEFCTQRSINFLLCAVHCLTVCWGRTVVVETFPYATFWSVGVPLYHPHEV
jgi:hypothetical protein